MRLEGQPKTDLGADVVRAGDYECRKHTTKSGRITPCENFYSWFSNDELRHRRASIVEISRLRSGGDYSIRNV